MDRNSITIAEEKVKEVIQGRDILFITTKNLDYIRNTQEIELIKAEANHFCIVGSMSKSYLKRLLHVYSKLLFSNLKKYDVVFVGFAPQLISPFWKWKFAGKKKVIDFFISMYDTFVNDRAKFKEGSLGAKVLKGIDRYTLKNADLIISDTKKHAQYFVNDLGADANKTLTLYLKADQEVYYPRVQRKPDNLKDKFVALYFGSVLPLQGVDVVLKAFEMLKQDDHFHFYMIGKIGDKYEKVLSSNIEYIDWVSQDKLAEYISSADLCLAGHFNNNIEKAKRTIPGKAYIYATMEKPMILGDNAANHELFSTNDKDVRFVKMGDPADLVKKIVEMRDVNLNGLN